MVKKITKYLKFVVCMALIAGLIAPSYAALSASDGSAFVTKAEFDAALADFNSRLTTFEAGINSKIDSQVSSYLDRNGIWSKQEQIIATAPSGYVPYKGTKSHEYIVGFAGSELLKKYDAPSNTHVWYGFNADAGTTFPGAPTSGLGWWRNDEIAGFLESKGRQWKKLVSNVSKTGLLYLLATTPEESLKYHTSETDNNLRYDIAYLAYQCDRSLGDKWRDKCNTSGKNRARLQFLYCLNFSSVYAAQVNHLTMSRYIATAPHEDGIASDGAMEVKETATLYNEILDSNTAKTKAGSLTVSDEPLIGHGHTAKVNSDLGVLEYGDFAPVFSIGTEQLYSLNTSVYMCFVTKGSDLYYGVDLDFNNDTFWSRSQYSWGFADYFVIKDCSVY